MTIYRMIVVWEPSNMRVSVNCHFDGGS